MRNVIGIFVFVPLLIGITAATGQSQNLLEKKIDSLFVIASSGEVKFQHLVQPAIDSIAALGAPAVPHLVDKLDTKSPRERLTIINTLKKIGPPAVPYLVTALSFDKGLVVERVAWALGDIKDTGATLGLLGVAEHPRWQVREQTISALGRIADKRGTQAVTLALGDTIPLVRKSASVAAGQLRANEAAAQLVHLLSDEFYGVRLTAAASLTQLDTPTVRQLLIDSLHSESKQIGNLACQILGQLADEQAMQILATETKSVDPERRSHAMLALVKADPSDRLKLRETFLAAETDRFTRLKVESAIAAARASHEQSAQSQ